MKYWLYKLCEFRNYFKWLCSMIRTRLICFVAGSDKIIIGGHLSSPNKKIKITKGAWIANCTFSDEETDYLVIF